MTILIVSDVHTRFDVLQFFLEHDAISACISCGDISESFPDEPSDLEIPKPIYTVYGNNEKWEYLEYDVDNLIWMEVGKVYDVKGVNVAGMGGVMSKSPHHPGHYSQGEVELSHYLKNEDVDIFISHQPPKYYADLCSKRRKHCGSPEVLDIMKNVDPSILISGHLHWQQIDIYSMNGTVDTQVITLGSFMYQDFAVLDGNKISLFKKGMKYGELFWHDQYPYNEISI